MIVCSDYDMLGILNGLVVKLAAYAIYYCKVILSYMVGMIWPVEHFASVHGSIIQM